MKLYLTVISFFAILAAVFGVVGPFLISAASTELVAIGIVLLVAAVPTLWVTGVSIFKQAQEKFKIEDDS